MFATLIPRLLYLFLLAPLCAWQWHTLTTAPPRHTPTSFTFTPGSTLPREAIGLPSGPPLQLNQLPNRTWQLHNPPLDLAYTQANQRQRIGAILLLPGQQWPLAEREPLAADLSAQPLHILATGPVLRLRDASGQTRLWDGASLLDANGQPLPACPGSGIKGFLRRPLSFWNRTVPSLALALGHLRVGGLLDCADQLAWPGLASNAASIAPATPGYRLLSLADLPALAPHGYRLIPSASLLPLSTPAPLPLAGVESLRLGQRRFTLRQGGQEWLAQGRQPWHAQPFTLPGIHIAWRSQDPWAWPWTLPPAQVAACGAGLFLALALALRLLWRERAHHNALVLASLSLGGAASALLLHSQAATIGALWVWGAQTVALLAVLAFPLQRTEWACLALWALLLAIGGTTHAALGMAGESSTSLRFYLSQQTKVAAVLWLCFGFAHLTTRSDVLRQPLRHWGLAGRALFLLAAGGLLLQALFGGEAGVAGIQPVEVAKTALIVLSAHWLARRIDGHALTPAARRAMARGLLAQLGLLLATLCALLAAVRDFSPLLLFAAWAIALPAAWGLVAQRPAALWYSLLGALALLGALLWLYHSNPLDYERLAVWRSPALHPHNGAQIRMAEALWRNAPLWGEMPAHPWRLPEVHNDMTPSYFLARFGRLGGLLLMLLQAAWIGTLLLCAARPAPAREDFQYAWLRRWRAFALYGWAALMAGHILLSWGSNLQWLPVMGQPMPFLSAAGSHIVLFALPLMLTVWLQTDRPSPGKAKDNPAH